MVGTNLQTLLNNVPYAVIMSACTDGLSEVDNAALTEHMNDLLDSTGMRYVPVTGVYKGAIEYSYVVMCNDVYDIMRLECMAIHMFHQESILVLDMVQSCAVLKYANKCDMIGRGLEQAVDLNEAMTYDGYTLIDGEYWVVV